MTSTAFEVCTPEEEEAFRAIEARQEEQGRRTASEQQSSQRERFERKCGYYPWCLPMERWESTGEYRSLETRRAWAVWQAACPDGWQAVPQSCHDLSFEALKAEGVTHIQALVVIALWKKALAAAPKPEDVCK